MAEPWDTYYAALELEFLRIYDKIGLVEDEMDDLSSALTGEGNPISGGQAYQMARDQGSLRSRWFMGSYSFRNRLEVCLRDLNERIEAGGGVDMASILTAMTSATFEQLTSFMGLTQAYKVAVWDAPFNEEFYAALARGFKTWGA